MAPASGEDEARLATIAAVALCGGGLGRGGSDVELARCLDALFEEVLWVGREPPPGTRGRFAAELAPNAGPLDGLVTVLAVAKAERVLIVWPDRTEPSADLLLALVAAPEADVVVAQLRGSAEPHAALCRRDRVLAAARAALEDGGTELAGLLDSLRPERLDVVGDALLEANPPPAPG